MPKKKIQPEKSLSQHMEHRGLVKVDGGITGSFWLMTTDSVDI